MAQYANVTIKRYIPSAVVYFAVFNLRANFNIAAIFHGTN
jgi:hypothetical protein